ncbi:MAG: cytochrome P450 [Chloroflexi bacterium]|nr:cytochrome P450 [Chloroflexota bacterium]
MTLGREEYSAARLGVRRLIGAAEITGHADVKAAARDWTRFSSDLQGDPDVRTYRQIPLEMDPPAHTIYRAILTPIFSRPAIALLEPELRAVARTLAAGFARRGSVEAVRDLAVPMVAAAIAHAFGRPQDTDELIGWGQTSWEIRPDGTRDGGRLEAYLDRVFDDAARHPGGDAFSLIDAAEVDGRSLTDLEKRGLGNLILAGGRDTVITLLCGAMWHLAASVDDRRSLVADPGRIPAAVEELLRFLSPLPRMERVATEPVDGEWWRASVGDVVLLGFVRANHDPSAFVDPGDVRLDRSPNPHVAFGNGPHTCIGVHLARLEARVFLEEILAVVPDWQVEAGSRIELATIGGHDVPSAFDRLPLVVGA